MLHLRADLLRPHIDNLLPRPRRLRGSIAELTLKERIAANWTLAITTCLRVGMASHARCLTCTILMGPGHEEPGVEGFCGTHSVTALPVPPPLKEDTGDVLLWIAGNSGH